MKSTGLMLFFTVFLTVSWGQSLSPVSLEQLVNTDVPTTQFNSQIAADPTGAYVIIWTTLENSGSIKARRFNSSHTAISAELTINVEDSKMINIEHWEDGKYVISYIETTGTTLKFAVLDQLDVVGAEVTVLASVLKYDLAPKGDSLAFLYGKSSNNQLYLRGYNLSTNAWLNTEVLATEIGGSIYDEPNIVYHANGRMTAIYHLYINTSGCCTFDRRVMRKTFSSSYLAEAPEYSIWSIGSDFSVGSDLDANGNANGEVIITTTHGTTSSQRYLRLWILGNTGSTIVNNAVLLPVVTTNDWYDNIEGHLYDNGDFLISKSIRTGGYTNPNDNEAYVIYGKNYNASNSGLLRMNSTVAGEQEYVSTAKLPNGGFVGCWSGNGFQGDTRGIYSRAYNAVSFPSVTFSNAGTYTISETGTTATIGVTLATQPTANVTVNLTSSDLTEGTVNVAQLTFTTANWNVAQNVTVTGVDDAADDGNITFNLVASTTGSADAIYAALPNKNQAIINLDNDATITVPSAQTICKSVGMTGVNAIITNVGPAITSVVGSSSDQTVVDNSDITINNLGGGTYGIVINNLNNNVTGTAQITLTANDGQFSYTGNFNVTTTGVAITTNATANTICQGESITLSATGAQNITWSNGVVNNVPFSPTVTTTYTATGDNGAGCSGSASQTITVNTVPASPTVSTSGSTAICGSGSVTLTSSYATGNTWSNGATTQSITVSNAGSYTVTFSNGGFCNSTSAPLTVTVNNTPAVPVITANGPTTFCAGGSVTLTSSQASGNTWSNGATTPSITVSASGTYSVTYSNGACSATSTPIVVTVNPASSMPIITTNGPTTFCAGGSVTLTSSEASGNTWSNGSTASSITVSTGGTYTVSSGGTCSATSAPLTVTVNNTPAVPVITANGPTTFCAGGSVTLISSQASGNTWSNGATISGITVSTTGTYSVTYSNGVCSSTSTPIVVTVNPVSSAPVITTNGPTTFCAGGSVTLTSSEASGNTWSNGSTASSITVSTGGTYTVSTGGTCSATSAPVAVTVNNAPAAPVITPNGPTTFCAGESVILTSSLGSGNSWSTGAVSQSINVAATNTYMLTYTDANGCVSPASNILITVQAAPNVSAGPDQTVCEGDVVTLLGSGASSYSWTGGITNGVSFPISNQATFEVTGTGINGCTSTDQVTVFVNSAPNVSAGANLVVCNGASITLNGSGAATYDWDNGVTNGVSFVPTLGTTTYTVTGISAGGCEAEDQMTVTVNQLPNVSISTIPIFCLSDGSAALTQGSPSGGTYAGTGITGVVFSPSTAGLGIYPVTYTYTDLNGCQNTASSTITVDQCLSVDELLADQLSVYPNPTVGLTTIELPGSFIYSVADAQGRIVTTGVASDSAQLDLTAFSDGVYQLIIQAENASTTVRIVKN